MLTGQRAVDAVMLEIDWIGGDPDSNKGGPPPTRDDVDLYCAEATQEQISAMCAWLDNNKAILHDEDD